MKSIPEAAEIRKKLAEWFRRNARDLPWRKTLDPYAIAVSEMMLQQTTVAAATPYYLRWMERFPSVEVLAKASEEEVLGLWQGLGYYSRARNLLRAAREVVLRRGGVFPREVEALRALPGFGPYTAGAVAAFAFDMAGEVIDANIARVLARRGNIRSPIDREEGKSAVRAEFRKLAPKGRGGRLFVGALMELGALVCRPRSPLCGHCPLRAGCRAEAPSSLPVKAPRPKTTKIVERRVFLRRAGKIGLSLSEGPRWKGLWLLPAAKEGGETLFQLTYSITRYLARLEVARGRAAGGKVRYFDENKLPPMPSPHARAVAAILKTIL